ncbi:thiamine phosphate synthase [Chelativorans sp. YIM 93263]|uniref:thiamine phosphate synthase n=1 Tax=Chelativorans sp. YIM 93263 TaxID=2906648 RepID=UPI002377F604|nr:thiamine phosphate synthase [Chelativorans sp. YIM 93263]
MSEQTAPPNRCRIVLIAPEPGADDAARLEAALSGGDVASLIIPAYEEDEDAFQMRAARLTPIAQNQGVAVVLAGEPRIAARVQADGIHFEGRKSELAEIIAKHHSRMMVGCGGAKSRDHALELGETQPDYIFFGRFGYDSKAEPHPRNLALAGWWSEMIEVPCIVLAGADVNSVSAVAETDAEFVALGRAVFAPDIDPAQAIATANELLDRHAPALDAVIK